MKKKTLKNNKLLSQKITLSEPFGPDKKTTVVEAKNLGDHCIQSGNTSAALEIYKQIVEQVPKYALCWVSLAECYLNSFNSSESLSALDRALELKPNDAQILLVCASLLSQLFYLERSLELLEKANKLEPRNGYVLYQLADIYSRYGEKGQAEDCLVAALKCHPRKGEVLWHMAAFSPSLAEQSQPFIEKRLKAGGDDPAERSFFFYALAKIKNEQQRYEEEYNCLVEANNIQSKIIPWSGEGSQLDLKAVHQQKDFFAEVESHNSPLRSKPILICSLPRSGSTLVERILGAHAEVSTTGESSIFTGAAVSASQTLFQKNYFASGLTLSNADDFFEIMNKDVSKKLDFYQVRSPSFTEKSISNAWSLGAALILDKSARGIILLRNPADIFLSCYQHYFSKGVRYTYAPDDFIAAYEMNKSLHSFWPELFPGRILTIRYEDLVEDQETISKRIVAFSGLDWDEACLGFHKSGGVVNTASVSQVRRKIYNTAAGKWKRYSKFLPDKIVALGAAWDEENLNTE